DDHRRRAQHGSDVGKRPRRFGVDKGKTADNGEAWPSELGARGKTHLIGAEHLGAPPQEAKYGRTVAPGLLRDRAQPWSDPYVG
ncbi:unnamed protein product, partial [Amoebophrya sp. A120]